MTQRCQATTRDGEPCSRPAHDGTAYCWQHQKSASQNAQDRKETFLEHFSSQMTTVEKAAAEAGVSRRTVYNWRDYDPEFAEAYKQAKEKQNDHRARKLAQSALQQCVKGEASASLHIYLLKVYGGKQFRQADRKDVHVEDESKDPAMQDLYERHKEELEQVNQQGERETQEATVDG